MRMIERSYEFLNEVMYLISRCNNLNDVYKEIEKLEQRLNEPLKVAVVGVISAGKSTLMNALLGEALLITGIAETTYRTTKFKYGDKPLLVVHFKDGSFKKYPLEEISFWTVKNGERKNEKIDMVQYIEIQYPNDFLKKIELIDTPGLGSTYVNDSQNTLEMLGIISEAERLTTKEAADADAIIYGFSRGIAENDENVLKAFQGPMFANASPINALGVLTKVDNYWGREISDPMKEGKKIADRYRVNSEIKRLLYSVFPVIGIMVQNLKKIGNKEHELLQRLSRLEESVFKKLIASTNNFITKEYESVDISVKDRKNLYDILGRYGVNTSVELIKKGYSLEELKEKLFSFSGIYELENVIRQHFGNRAFIIKLNYILARIKTLSYELLNRYNNNDKIKDLVECILSECEKLEAEEHTFAELKVLQSYYNGELNISEEESRELLEITGEYGVNCEARLGVAEGISITKLAQIAKEKARKWNIKANEFGIFSLNYEKSCRVLARSCEIMYYHLSSLSGD